MEKNGGLVDETLKNLFLTDSKSIQMIASKYNLSKEELIPIVKYLDE